MYTPQALWTMAREKVDITVVVVKNENYGILNIELARMREGDANDKMLSMMHLNNPSLDWVRSPRDKECRPPGRRPPRSSTISSRLR